MPRSQSQKQKPQPLSRSQGRTVDGGSLDGLGAADHDQPDRFGWRPRSSGPYPFSIRQYSRLRRVAQPRPGRPAWSR